jgi:hypothetical protein
LRLGGLPEVHQPSIEARRLRTELSVRRQLVRQRTGSINQARGLLRGWGVRLPARFFQARGGWKDLEAKKLPEYLRPLLETMKGVYEQLTRAIRQVEATLNTSVANAVTGPMGIMRKKVNWVLDVDIRDFFGSISHEWMVKFLQHRIADRRILRLIGTYVFGAGTTQQVELTADLNMYANNKMYTHPPQLNWTRKGTMTRPLFHLGDRTFYPAGAPSVRIRFTEQDGTVLMAVSDAELVLTARRKPESK